MACGLDTVEGLKKLPDLDSFFRTGELSGEREGKEVRDLSVVAVVGVVWLVEMADECFRGLMRAWFDSWLLAEAVLLVLEGVCCGLFSTVPSMACS